MLQSSNGMRARAETDPFVPHTIDRPGETDRTVRKRRLKASPTTS